MPIGHAATRRQCHAATSMNNLLFLGLQPRLILNTSVNVEARRIANGQQERALGRLALLALLQTRETSRAGAGACTTWLRRQAFRLRVVEHRRIGVQTLGHLVADEVDEALEYRRHVDVVLGGRLVKF